MKQTDHTVTVAEPKHITFRLAEPADAEFILGLRMDESKNKHLSAVNNDLDGQRQWLLNYKEREKRHEEFYFIILGENGRGIGLVRLYDFQGDSFCWGSWILCSDAPSYAAIESALLVYETAFYRLGFNKSHFDVRKKNSRVLEFHKRFGSVVVDEDEDNYYLTISKETYEKTKLRYRKFLRG